MLTRFDFSSDASYDAYLLERDARSEYVSLTLSLQEKINELEHKIEKCDRDYHWAVSNWNATMDDLVLSRKTVDSLSFSVALMKMRMEEEGLI